MKLSIKYILFNILLLISFTFLGEGCKKSLDDSLDVTPNDRLTSNVVFANTSIADLVLNDIYNSLPDANNWSDVFDNWTDNSICGFGWVNSRNVVEQATFTPSNIGALGGVGLDWSANYSFIRKCNVFITNLSKSPLPDSYKVQRLAEARFLRAYFYHLLWMTYGGVPIITNPLDISTQGNAIFYARSSSDDTYNFIVAELVAIQKDLPTVPTQAGRVSQGAALTLEGWVQLYNHKYIEAAATNKYIIDNMGAGKVYNLFPDYASLFLDNTANTEAIFYKQYIPSVHGNAYAGYNGPTFTAGGAETSWGGVGPTQELVDDYEMSNGLPINNPASGYDPKHPYLNREKRFYQSIVYDGSYFYNDTIYTRQAINSPNEIDLASKNDATQTGYYIRKNINVGIPLGASNWSGYTGGQNYYYFRYAEVLLNYAEAQNEAIGPDATVLGAINTVRTRADLPNLQGGLNQSQMRDAIRRERRVELAFENKRWWDLIRWKLAEVNLNQQLHGIAITSDGKGRFNYTPVTTPGGDRKFDAAKNYLFPIPQDAINKNSKLKQNPGF